MRRGAKSKGFVRLARCNREFKGADKRLKDFEDFSPAGAASASAPASSA
jgi:hypothetical protein